MRAWSRWRRDFVRGWPDRGHPSFAEPQPRVMVYVHAGKLSRLLLASEGFCPFALMAMTFRSSMESRQRYDSHDNAGRIADDARVVIDAVQAARVSSMSCAGSRSPDRCAGGNVVFEAAAAS